MKPKYPIVEIEWVDSGSARGWESAADVEERIKDNTTLWAAGYLYRKNKYKVVLIGMFDGQKTGNMSLYHEIPIACVKHIRRLR